MIRVIRWTLAGLAFYVGGRLMNWGDRLITPYAPTPPDLTERVMLAIAADHGEGMARRQLAARSIARQMATGERADPGGTTGEHYSVRKRVND